MTTPPLTIGPDGVVIPLATTGYPATDASSDEPGQPPF
jgi:hypothetical protein